MMPAPRNRFQDFFDDHRYVALKNHLYNYILRKRAIERFVLEANGKPILEVGSGLSPMITDLRPIVYVDLSLSALQELRMRQRHGWFVVADGAHLPFKTQSFSQVVCSEVLEHLRDDLSALKEMGRIVKPSGILVITFPHRHFYYASDDRFVRHLRRYELSEMSDCLKMAGLDPVAVRKVLGPLEKVTMLFAISFYLKLSTFQTGDGKAPRRRSLPAMIVSALKWISRVYAILVWLDARIMPRRLSTVLLVKALKR